MSIFKDTLKEKVYNQIKAREKVVSGENDSRSTLLPFYLSKNGWVRMTSFVDYVDGTVNFPGYGEVEIDPTTANYQGDQLAKKYILQGGTLYTKDSGGKTLAQLRKGIGGEGGAYGSDTIDTANGTKTDWYRTYGIRPMPGITSVEMKTINAYGSVYESTVKFYAWDTHQLNELEILFMRPGYSVLLEWGWSQYIDNSGRPQIFNGATINPFASGLTLEKVYNQLEGLRQKYDYNYDGMVGYVKNFNWTMMDNGGFECTTTIISMGEVMTSLRMAPSSNYNPNQSNPDLSNTAKSYYDDYETVLLSLKYKAEASFSPSLSNVEGTNTYVIAENDYYGKFDQTNAISDTTIVEKLISSGFPIEAENLRNEPYIKNLVTPKEGYGEEGSRFEYISLSSWIAILASYFELKTGQDIPFVRFFPPGVEDFCLAGPDSISSDLRICAINNPEAFPEFTNVQPEGYPSTGINPLLSQNKNYIINGEQPTINLPAFFDSSRKSGQIAFIYVNIDLLLNEYTSMKSSSNGDGVALMEYVQNVLNKISGALGGINDFKLTTASRDQNILKIYDNFYLEQRSEYNSKKMLNLSGLNSIFKEVKINSKIFPEQSTMIAIAAQSRANLGTIYNSSQVYLNAGITDRLSNTKYQGNEITSPRDQDVDPVYQKLLDFLIYIKNAVVGKQEGNQGWQIDPNLPTDPSVYLKQFLLRFDGDIGFKALIPFTLTLKLEGLGGFVIGQIFTVDKNILPKNYYDKKLGFIITRIAHRLNNNSWETELETQICLLDQQKFYDESGISKLTKNIKREGFEEWIKVAKIEAILYPIMIDFLIYQAMRSFAGYLWASIDDSSVETTVENLINGDYFKADGDYNGKSDVEYYWGGNNIQFFANNSGTKITPRKDFNGTKKYDLNEFNIFVEDWITNYENANANNGNLAKLFTENQTLGQVLKLIKVGNPSQIANNELTNTYRSTLQKIDLLFRGAVNPDSSPLSFLWPSGQTSMWPKGEDMKNMFTKNQDYFLFLTNLTGTTDDEYSINYAQLIKNAETVVKSQFPSLSPFYQNLNLYDKTPIKNIFDTGKSGLYVPLNIQDLQSLKDYGNTINWFDQVNSKIKPQKLSEDITT